MNAMTDAYERTHMRGVGKMLHRAKVTTPRGLLAVPVVVLAVMGMLGSILLAAVGAPYVALGVGLGALALAAFFGFMSLTFGAGRVAVSEGEIHIQLGMAGPKIPIEDVARVRVAPSGFNRVGMGVNKDLRGTTVFRMWGDNAHAVHIEQKDGSRTVLVIEEPDAVASAIQEALARRSGSVPLVRAADAVLEEAEEAPAAPPRGDLVTKERDD